MAHSDSDRDNILTAAERAKLDKVLEIAATVSKHAPSIYVIGQSPAEATQAQSDAFVAIFNRAVDLLLPT